MPCGKAGIFLQSLYSVPAIHTRQLFHFTTHSYIMLKSQNKMIFLQVQFYVDFAWKKIFGQHGRGFEPLPSRLAFSWNGIKAGIKVRTPTIILIGRKSPFMFNIPSGHLPLTVPNVKFNFDVSVWHCLLSTPTSKLNSTLGTHLHAIIRTHHFDFDGRFWPTHMLKTLHRI